MTKFTMGPWAWRRFGEHPILVADYGRRDVILSAQVFAGLPLIVERGPAGYLEPVDPNGANARLIASAPTLIATLVMIRQVIEAHHKIEPEEEWARLAVETIDGVIRSAADTAY